MPTASANTTSLPGAPVQRVLYQKPPDAPLTLLYVRLGSSLSKEDLCPVNLTHNRGIAGLKGHYQAALDRSGRMGVFRTVKASAQKGDSGYFRLTERPLPHLYGRDILPLVLVTVLLLGRDTMIMATLIKESV